MVSIYSELFARLLSASIRLQIATKMHRQIRGYILRLHKRERESSVIALIQFNFREIDVTRNINLYLISRFAHNSLLFVRILLRDCMFICMCWNVFLH